jgi:glutamine amidotransferase
MSSPRIAIIDYGVSNIASVHRLFSCFEMEVSVVTSPLQIDSNESCIVLPGVGNWDFGVQQLIDSNFFEYLQDGKWRKLIGICLGFQLLGHSSQEGSKKGLGILNMGCSNLLGQLPNNKIVNSGWKEVTSEMGSPIQGGAYYFTHSFGFTTHGAKDHEARLELAKIQNSSIVAGAVSERVVGLQFHPEKSHARGKRLIESLRNGWI